MVPLEAIARAIKKAAQSPINYRICAIGLNSKGEVLGYAHNTMQANNVKERQLHAERHIMLKHPSVKTIVIVRIGHSGKILPIEPCEICAKMASKNKVKIISVGA